MFRPINITSQAMACMIQIAKANWRIETLTGHIMQKDITCGTVIEAEEYVKKYISSFDGWSYRVIPLTLNKNR